MRKKRGMGRLKGRVPFSILFIPLLLVWSMAWAGAPAPAPALTTPGPHRPEHQIANLGDFRFESGEIVKDFKVSYVTHGKLSAKKDNVILVMDSFTSNHHVFDYLIGSGKALDPDKYFVVATDGLGNADLGADLTTGPTNSGLKMEFPHYRIFAKNHIPDATFIELDSPLGHLAPFGFDSDLTKLVDREIARFLSKLR